MQEDFKMKRYLVHQTIVGKSTGSNTPVDVIIRNVGADSEAEAIGKFILNTGTEGLDVVSRLSPFCYELDDLTKID